MRICWTSLPRRPPGDAVTPRDRAEALLNGEALEAWAYVVVTADGTHSAGTSARDAVDIAEAEAAIAAAITEAVAAERERCLAAVDSAYDCGFDGESRRVLACAIEAEIRKGGGT